MSQQKAISANAVHNAGSVIAKTGAHTVLAGQNYAKSYGAKVVLSSGTAKSSGNLGTASVFSAADSPFPYNQEAGNYLGVKMTQHLAGQAAGGIDPFFFGPASSSSEKMRAIPYIESARSLGSGVSTSFNYKTGVLTKGAGAGESRSFGQDHAARPTNAIPGELVYMTDAKLPASGDYKPKTAP
jgi:hypothetical protein